MLVPSMFDKMSPRYAAAAKTLNKKFTSNDIKKLDADLWKELPKARSILGYYERNTTNYLRGLANSLDAVESQRGALVKCVTEIYGYEKIISKQTKDFGKAVKAGDAKKGAAIEAKLKKNITDYGKKMVHASKITGEIEADLKTVREGIKKLAGLPKSAPTFDFAVKQLPLPILPMF